MAFSQVVWINKIIVTDSIFYVPGSVPSIFSVLSHLILATTLQVGTVIIPILQMKNLRCKEARYPAQGHKASK